MIKKTVRKKKTRKKMKTSNRKSSASYQNSFSEFKARIDKIFGQIDWMKVGKFVIAGLLVLGAMGAFGPKIQFVAFAVLNSLNLA
ncbi:MAG: hypothetical protein ACXWC9_01860 [Pseudobdellovibrionaceae bacterium]